MHASTEPNPDVSGAAPAETQPLAAAEIKSGPAEPFRAFSRIRECGPRPGYDSELAAVIQSAGRRFSTSVR
jgi:hypothetical protein